VSGIEDGTNICGRRMGKVVAAGNRGEVAAGFNLKQ